MMEVNVKEARGNFSSLLDRVERGEEIIIKRRGKKLPGLFHRKTTSFYPACKTSGPL
mgnify:CR=1 FL=1